MIFSAKASSYKTNTDYETYITKSLMLLMVEQELRLVELKDICPSGLNPRLGMNIECLNELAESIK